MRFVDSHCHVDLYPDYLELIEETERAGVYTIGVTNTPSVFRRCLSLTQGKFVRAALGLHPQLVAQRHSELALMLDMLTETRYIGEIGLDFGTSDASERTLQEKVFATILDRCAAFPEKVLTVHSRRAARKVVSVIGNSYPCSVILHWFSGSQRELEDAIAAGFYFSANSAMLTSEKGRKLLARIPRERLLTESDGPFVSVNGKPDRPKNMPNVVLGLAELLEINRDEMAEIIYENFRRILDH
jgi:TatD DNase family protein